MVSKKMVGCRAVMKGQQASKIVTGLRDYATTLSLKWVTASASTYSATHDTESNKLLSSLNVSQQ